MRISDWSSDVCSSDLATEPGPEKPSPPSSNARASQPTASNEEGLDKTGAPSVQIEAADAEDLRAQREDRAFEAASAALKQAMEQLPDLKGLEKALHIEITEEGLRIQQIGRAHV